MIVATTVGITASKKLRGHVSNSRRRLMTATLNRYTLGTTLLRLIVGTTFIAHGAQKLFAFGFAGTAGFLGSIGVPMAQVMAPLLIATALGVALVTLSLQGSGAFALDNVIGRRPAHDPAETPARRAA
jgi:uncharacterized membrane protein YphA (DoxX/SURF4 family)